MGSWKLSALGTTFHQECDDNDGSSCHGGWEFICVSQGVDSVSAPQESGDVEHPDFQDSKRVRSVWECLCVSFYDI